MVAFVFVFERVWRLKNRLVSWSRNVDNEKGIQSVNQAVMIASDRINQSFQCCQWLCLPLCMCG